MQNDNKEWAVLIKCKAFELTPERIAAEWNTQAIINQSIHDEEVNTTE